MLCRQNLKAWEETKLAVNAIEPHPNKPPANLAYREPHEAQQQPATQHSHNLPQSHRKSFTTPQQPPFARSDTSFGDSGGWSNEAPAPSFSVDRTRTEATSVVPPSSSSSSSSPPPPQSSQSTVTRPDPLGDEPLSGLIGGSSDPLDAGFRPKSLQQQPLLTTSSQMDPRDSDTTSVQTIGPVKDHPL